LRRGYAAASTDTGHTGTDASFAVGHPERLIDFGYRAVHETAVQGKATVKALYGAAPRISYFNGCSGGGRQAFMEAQRFPEDFEGIIAGAPGYNRTDAAFQTIQMIQATHKDAASFIPESKLPAIHQAAVNACDSQDGLKDGLISEPVKCQFDPGVIACKGADGPNCLTMPQVVAARAIYAPVIHPRTKQEVSTGLEPGSELHWDSVAVDRPHSMYNDLLRFIVFRDPNWDYRTLDVAKHLDLARKADNGVLLADSTSLKPFIDRGGKLLLIGGWNDHTLAPGSFVDYYDAVVKAVGPEKARSAVRLFMVPGMAHCAGGVGPDRNDAVTAVIDWVEKGKAPDQLIASKVNNGQVVRTRPLCPYPQVARYKGQGSVDDAANFSCVAP
jgi:feruloyl esterase